jgi:DNA-binding NarL/FixJ family response regulator
MKEGGVCVHTGHERSAVILDEHPIWLDALERILEELGFESVGKTTDPTEALALIKEHRPTLFLLDIDAKSSRDGLAYLKEATSIAPSLKTIVLSEAEDPERIDAALGSGAVAYVVKRAEPGDLSSAIRQAFTRSLYLAGSSQSRPGAPAETDTAGLTRREREILRLVAEGRTNGEVAGTLWVTEQTVKFHLANIFRKLDVTNRTQASRWAHAHGLLGENGASEAPEGSPFDSAQDGLAAG